MSLQNYAGESAGVTDVDPGYIDEASMESLCAAVLTESLSPDEMDEFIQESATLDIVTEKNIVKLDKKAKLSRAYKVGILQCAAEDGRKEYKKLRKLWKLEAIQFKKLEKTYKHKAMAKAKEAVKRLGRSKSKNGVVAAQRSSKALGGTNKLIKSGVIKKK